MALIHGFIVMTQVFNSGAFGRISNDRTKQLINEKRNHFEVGKPNIDNDKSEWVMKMNRSIFLK